MSTVLVTGGSGFVGSHAIVQLLNAGHSVHATVRDLARGGEVRAMVARGGADAGARLSLFAADLLKDDGWTAAVAGCDYVLHVASPMPLRQPANEDDLIVPAREGTLRVLRAARDAGVKRVVLTSSFAAIGYGQPGRTAPFDETCWTDPTHPEVPAYMRSKTLAERAAWDFIAREGGGMEMAAINPTGIFGPALGPDLNGSLAIIKGMLTGAIPVVPRINFGVVDVRDVVDLHVRAMLDPAAAGQRFIATSGEFMWLREIAAVLRARLGDAARKAPRHQLPDFVVRLAALVAPMARPAVPLLGVVRNATSEKAIRLLGWTPRAPEDAIVAAGESLGRLGLL